MSKGLIVSKKAQESFVRAESWDEDTKGWKCLGSECLSPAVLLLGISFCPAVTCVQSHSHYPLVLYAFFWEEKKLTPMQKVKMSSSLQTFALCCIGGLMLSGYTSLTDAFTLIQI